MLFFRCNFFFFFLLLSAYLFLTVVSLLFYLHILRSGLTRLVLLLVVIYQMSRNSIVLYVIKSSYSMPLLQASRWRERLSSSDLFLGQSLKNAFKTIDAALKPRPGKPLTSLADIEPSLQEWEQSTEISFRIRGVGALPGSGTLYILFLGWE